MSDPILEMAAFDAPARERLRALNNAHAEETSFLMPDEWQRLSDIAFAALAVREGAFLITLDQDADHASPNFAWVRARRDRFVYVDRIVVDGALRGRGIARRLYETFFEAARCAGHDRVLCEVNRVPPNPGSDAFHAALGFREIGRGEPTPGKVVRYLERML